MSRQILNSLGEPIKDIIRNSEGKPIILSKREQHLANYLQQQVSQKHIKNSLGGEINITTLTTIMKKVTTQKFYEIPIAEYMPVRVGGEGAWSSTLTTYISYSTGSDFSAGIVNQGGNNGRMASVGTAVEALSIKTKTWGKTIDWTLAEVYQATKTGNWDLITSLEASRKRNWDLGLQAVAFLGMPGDSSVLGLLTQSVTNNVADLTKSLSSMTAAELVTFVKIVLDRYRVNCSRTSWPTNFVIPESDYLGLAAPLDSTFAFKSKMEIMQDTFRIMTKNPGFQIQPLAYCDAAYNKTVINVGTGKQMYALYNNEEESLRMDVPVNYTNTLANSVNGFQFQNVGYGQFTGVLAYRAPEMMYFSY